MKYLFLFLLLAGCTDGPDYRVHPGDNDKYWVCEDRNEYKQVATCDTRAECEQICQAKRSRR